MSSISRQAEDHGAEIDSNSGLCSSRARANAELPHGSHATVERSRICPIQTGDYNDWMLLLRYAAVLKEIERVIKAQANAVTAMDAAVQLLKARNVHYTWVGIYLLEGDELVLGPFRGTPSPHTRIPLGRGICGAAATAKATIIVDDVHADPRYLACSIDTKSEIVVPIMDGERVLGEIDIDGDRIAAFTSDDRELLERVAAIIAAKLRTQPRKTEST